MRPDAGSGVVPPGALDGRGVLVTGGSMGIGLACAEEALAAGARVVIAARGEDALRSAESGLAARYPGRIGALTADVAHADSVEALVSAATSRLGRLDGVVHAAAVMGPIGTILEVEPEAWLEAVRVDLFGAFLVARAAGLAMRRSGGGRIVLFSGGGATTPFPNYTAYACSKAGVARLAETIATELAPDGIAVNCLAPGFVATRIHEETLAAGERAGAAYLERTRAELERGGVPASLAARAATFLLSDAAAGISGRLLAAPWDAWWEWPARVRDMEGTDLFTLRRIVPRDRGGDWQ